jgi:hypothetical protein
MGEKGLRRIFGPICGRGCYRIRTKEGVYRIYKPRTRHGNYNLNIEAEMARPCKQGGR